MQRSLARHYAQMKPKRYEALTSASSHGQGAARYEVDPAQIAPYLGKAAPDGFPSPHEATLALAKHFSREFPYTFKRGMPPTIRAMLAEGEGNCHVKAALFVAALRYLGVPAEITPLFGEREHAMAKVHLPEGMVGVDFTASAVQVTTQEHVWHVFDNAVTARDVRAALPGFPPERRLEMLVLHKAGRGILLHELPHEEVSTPLEKLLKKEALGS